MLVVAKKSEEKLLEEMRQNWRHDPAQRCLQLRFSQVENDVEEWFAILLSLLPDYLDDRASKVFLCEDKDVFVLTRSLTNKRVQDLLTHLAPKLSPAPECSLPGLVTLFEIGVSWPQLRGICEKKIEDVAFRAAMQKRKSRQVLNKVSCTKALETIDESLVGSLSERRRRRLEPQIMVVEDDPFSQRLVMNALKSKYEISITKDGAGALMNYVHSAPDILFLDIGLPDIDGHEVLRRLFEFDPDAYVVMFSGNGDRENVMKAVELGAKGFVGKPFTQERLLKYISQSPFIQEKTKRESADEATRP